MAADGLSVCCRTEKINLQISEFYKNIYLHTQAPIVLREDIRQHGCTILGQEDKKKKDILLSSIESDLNQKVCNDEARETELRKLIKKGRADYNMQKGKK